MAVVIVVPIRLRPLLLMARMLMVSTVKRKRNNGIETLRRLKDSLER